MLSFQNVYNLIQEGLFEIPRSSFQEIFDYVLDIYKKTKFKNVKIKPKMFRLNLENTKYKFLSSYYDPRIKVFFFKNKNKPNGYYYLYDEEYKTTTVYGCIYLNLYTPLESTLLTTIEHEILHYIQDLLKEYKLEKTGNFEKGGMTPKKYSSETKNRNKYVKHALKSTEHYTNLNSIIRELQNQYQTSLDIKKIPDSLENRKGFFVRRLENIQTDNKGTSRFSKILNILKSHHPKLYSLYLKIIYKAFVNNESSFNYHGLEKALNEYDKVENN